MNTINFIIFYISNILMSIGISYSFSKISNIKLNLSIKNMAIIMFFSVLLTLNNYYNVVTLKLVVAFILGLLMETFIYKINFKESFVIVLIIMLMSVILEVISLPLIPKEITNIEIFNDKAILKLLYSIINTILLILTNKNKYIIKLINKIKIIITNFINFYTVGILLICLLNIIIYFYSYNMKNIQLTLGIILSIIIFSLFIKTIINDKYNNILLKEKNKALKNEFKAYSDTIDECRELKHNLKNDLYFLKANLSKENQSMINQIIIKYNKNYEWISTLDDIPEGLQGLLYLKINEAKKRKVKILLDIQSHLKTSENDYLNLSTILGILIDNAIEASEKSKSKTMVINISEKKDIINIKIINRYINNIDITKIGNKNYSTKEYKSGLGLNFIKKINNHNIKVTFKIINDLFITKISYKNKNLKIK